MAALRDVQGLVEDELLDSLNKHDPMNSPHEGYAVILEEVRELEREVFTNPTRGCITPADKAQARLAHLGRMRDEAVQVAAMAQRFIMELT